MTRKLYVSGFFVFFVMFLFPMFAEATACTGVSGKSGTCSGSSGCSGTLEYESGGNCTGSTPYCCIPKDAGGGACPVSDCMTTSACNARGKNYSADNSRKCPTNGDDVCCILTIDIPGGGGGTPGGSVSIPNPLGDMKTVEAFLGKILNALQGIIVLLALVFIVFGALVYVTSGGNDKRIELAKEVIFAAMIGLALGIAAPSFLKEIAKILGWGSDKLPSEVSAAKTITQILFNVLDFFLGILGVLALIMLIIGAFMYVTSAGNDDMIKRGKSIVVWSSVGVVVAFSALILINQLASFF